MPCVLNKIKRVGIIGCTTKKYINCTRKKLLKGLFISTIALSVERLYYSTPTDRIQMRRSQKSTTFSTVIALSPRRFGRSTAVYTNTLTLLTLRFAFRVELNTHVDSN